MTVLLTKMILFGILIVFGFSSSISAQFSLNCETKGQEIFFLLGDSVLTCTPSVVFNYNGSVSQRSATVYVDNSKTYKGLRMNNRNLPFIPHGLGKYFPNLTNLVLSKNELKTVEEAEMESLVNLQKIDLSYNLIEYIEGEVFKFNPNLTEIHLDYNKISYLNPGLFDKLRNLTKILLSDNICVSAIWTASNQHSATKFTENCSYRMQSYGQLQKTVQNLAVKLQLFENIADNLTSKLQDQEEINENQQKLNISLMALTQKLSALEASSDSNKQEAVTKEVSSSLAVAQFVIIAVLLTIFAYAAVKIWRNEVMVMKRSYAIADSAGYELRGVKNCEELL